MVDSFLRQGIPEVAKQLTKKSTKAIDWDTAVKNISKDLHPSQTRVVEDLIQTKPGEAVQLLDSHTNAVKTGQYGTFEQTFR